MRQALRKQYLNHHHLIGQQRPLVFFRLITKRSHNHDHKMNPRHYAPNPKLSILNPTFMLIAPNHNNGNLTRSQQETKKIKIMKVCSWGVSCNMNRDNARKCVLPCPSPSKDGRMLGYDVIQQNTWSFQHPDSRCNAIVGWRTNNQERTPITFGILG